MGGWYRDAPPTVRAIDRDERDRQRRPSRNHERAFDFDRRMVDSPTCPTFRFVAPFEPTGDQPQAIERLTDGLGKGLNHQVLLGATGTGKTLTIAKVIEAAKRPTLVLAHNKTLAAQLYAEFRDFFPDNAVEYFVSYFDYYQPEAYLPRSDTYIEKDSSRNDEIDRLRHAATHSLFERRDVIVVASRELHLRHRRAGRLRRDRPQAPTGRLVPPRQRPSAPRRPAVPAQRRGPRARALPRPRRHPRVPPGVARSASSGSSSSATRSSGSPRSTR